MQRDYGEQPPPDYFEVVNPVQPPNEAVNNHNAAVIAWEAAGSHDEIPVETAVRRVYNVIQDTIKYLKHPSRFEGSPSGPNCLKGFLDVMSEQKKLPFGFTKVIIYNLILLVYYFTNFIYSIVAVSVQGDHIVHYIFYLLISLTGLLFEAVVITVDVREALHHNTSVQTEHQNAGQQNYCRKAQSVFIDYVLLSLGEFLIYPTLICTLYGVINERAWRFDNGISGCNFLFFLYSVIMDVMFTKIHAIWLVIRIIRATHKKYGKPWECKSCFTPVYLTVPFVIMTALTHWVMIGIIGVRIYIDNFTPDRDTGNNIPNTGDYRVTPFTGYMIGFSLCLPAFSPAVYILLNKLWFYEVYTVSQQSNTNRTESTAPQLSWNIKLFASARDPLAYVTVINLMVLFIVFVVGAYLSDYDSTDCEVSQNARNAIQGLGPCFIVFFLISNLQAAIAFTIIVLTVVTMLLCMLCTVCACLYSRDSE